MSRVLIESEPSITYFILVNEANEFYDGFGVEDNKYRLVFTHLLKEACCFESKPDAKKWMNKNKVYITNSKHKITIKKLVMSKSTTYEVK